MNELDFTIEFNSDVVGEELEDALFREAESRLRELANGHTDLIGAAVTVRQPASGTTPPLFEATVVAYIRPENIAATEKAEDATGALKGALKAVERQVRERRKKLRETWKKPANDPVTTEVTEVTAAEEEET